MKILHTSHKGLPDQRIERASFVARKNGHDVVFLGMGKNRSPEIDVFSKITMLPSINNRQVVTDKTIRKKWASTVEEISPDLIHANDLIAAVFSADLGIPMVYDDHEYWSAQRIVYNNWPIWKRIAIRPFLQSIPKWEQRIVSRHTTITVSEAIAAEHRRFNEDVFVLHNYCLRNEVQDLPINPNRTNIAYVGDDFHREKFSPHRDMTGLRDIVKFDDFAGLTRHELYLNLTRYRYGLLPFKANQYSRYADSAKVYDYLNCGLEVIMTDVLFQAHGHLPYTIPFSSYEEIPRIVKEREPSSPIEIMEYAHRNLVWEAQEDKLLEAYRHACET